MPNVPTVDAPTQSQSGAPLNINAPAASFGASVLGDSMAKLGEVFQGSSDAVAKHAEQYQALNNKAEADAAYVTHLDAVNKFAADYQKDNRGLKADTNLPAAMATLNQQREDISDTLSNPMARAMFDADSRRATSNITGELSRFAASQLKDYRLKQSSAVQEALFSDSVIHPANFGANMAKMMQSQADINEQLGLSPEAGDLEARKLYANTVAGITKTFAGNGDIQGASKFLEDHKEGMDGKIYADTLMQLKPAMLANDAASLAHDAVQDALHGLNSSVGPTVDYLNNVHGREGEGKNPASTANGIGQFTEGTWMRTMKNDPQFAQDIAGKTPAQILQMRHDPSVANRAIISYGQANATELGSKGYSVNAATVGLAHGYGPDGAEKILSALDHAPATKIDDIIGHQVAINNRVAGQTVQQVVGAFTQRFGTASADGNNVGTPTSYQLAAREQAVLALVHNNVVAKYGENAQIEDMARGKALSELQAQVGVARNTETSAYTTLGSFAMNNQIQDMPTLLGSVPGGLQMYNSLPLSQRTQLQADIHRNAAELTPNRFANITALDGMYGSRSLNPQAFLDADIAHMDLTQSARLSWMAKQAEFRGKPQANVDPEAKALALVIGMPEYKSVMGSDGLGIKPNSNEEFLLRGAIAGQLQNWLNANPGKAPQQKDIVPMIARATAQQKYQDVIPGTNIPFGRPYSEQHLPDISDEDKIAITAALTKRNIPVSPYTIGKYYSMGKGTK